MVSQGSVGAFGVLLPCGGEMFGGCETSFGGVESFVGLGPSRSLLSGFPPFSGCRTIPVPSISYTE